MDNFEKLCLDAPIDVNFVLVDDDTEHTDSTGKSERKSFHKIRFLVFALIISLVSGGLGAAVALNALNSGTRSFGKLTSHSALSISSSEASRINTAHDSRGGDSILEKATGSTLKISEIAALNANSVVEIRTESVATDFWMQQYIKEGAGSGVIISSDGYIVTNSHVIEGSQRAIVTLKNGESYKAKLVGRDGDTDLAILKISAKGLTPAVYGDSNKLSVGDIAVVIGNPLGELGGTVTAGIISALDRSITISGKAMTLLQTDASVNPGNSGGGIFNQRGELIGIVVAKSGGSNVEGLGFAIPINSAKKVLQDLASHGYVKGRATTGLTFVDLTSMPDALVYGVQNLGIYVKSVNLPLAEKSGFKKGDMIYYVEDKRIESSQDLLSAFENRKVGEKVKVTVVRNNKIVKLTLTLSEKPANYVY